MKTIAMNLLRLIFTFGLLAFLSATIAEVVFGQDVKVQVKPDVDPQVKVQVNPDVNPRIKVQVNPQVRVQVNLDHLAARAKKMVDVNIDGSILDLARNVLDDKDPEERKAKEAIAGLKGIYVKVFEFEREGAYSPNDLEAIRAQFRPPAWQKIIGVVSQKDGDNAEVYTNVAGTQVVGLAVIVAEPKELTFVNIVGPVDVGKLRALGGNFGIPGITIKISGDKDKRDDKDDDENKEDKEKEAKKSKP